MCVCDLSNVKALSHSGWCTGCVFTCNAYQSIADCNDKSMDYLPLFNRDWRHEDLDYSLKWTIKFTAWPPYWKLVCAPFGSAKRRVTQRLKFVIRASPWSISALCEIFVAPKDFHMFCFLVFFGGSVTNFGARSGALLDRGLKSVWSWSIYSYTNMTLRLKFLPISRSQIILICRCYTHSYALLSP